MRAYKYKLRPVSAGVARRLVETLSLCRELYNAALQERRDAWRINRKSVSFASQSRQLPEIKLLRPDLDAVYAQVLQNVLRRLDQSFAAFFRRMKSGERPGYPRFKADGRYHSFTYPQDGFKLDGDRLTLSKIGRVRLRLSREIGGWIKTCTIKREADGWYAVFAVEEDRSRYFPKTGEEAGFDMGLASFITGSDGSQVPNPRWSREAEREQKRLQRAVSRKKLGSGRRKKARAALRRFHQRVARRRLDFFHKLALDLIRRYDTIYVEDLRIQNLVRNHYLAKAILDASWGLFISILCGKASERPAAGW